PAVAPAALPASPVSDGALLAKLAATTPASPGPPRATPRPTLRSTPRPTPRPTPRATATPVPAPAPTPPPATPAPDRSVHHVDTNYRGVVITTAQINGSDPHGLLPSYAVSHGVGILATHLDEVKAVIDAQSGASVTSAPGYRNAIGQAQKDNNAVLYVDVASVVSALRDNLSGSDRRDFDKVAPNLAPLKSFLITSQVQGNRATLRMFLGIG
ncbi:MAG: hypothetical protein ABR564_10070, partial [Candidatus Dormibacteria bacterium]